MAINNWMAQKIISLGGKVHNTSKGNSYKAVALYDKDGRLHGHAIYVKYNDVEPEKPDFMKYVPIRKPERPK